MKMRIFSFRFGIMLATFLLVLAALSTFAEKAASAEKTAVILRAYGPGGPAPAMREAAKVFGEKKELRWK